MEYHKLEENASIYQSNIRAEVECSRTAGGMPCMKAYSSHVDPSLRSSWLC
jgi:hypothetical protein